MFSLSSVAEAMSSSSGIVARNSVMGEQYGRSIHSQKEVHGMSYSSQDCYWKAMEGIFMNPSELLKAEFYHAEL